MKCPFRSNLPKPGTFSGLHDRAIDRKDEVGIRVAHLQRQFGGVVEPCEMVTGEPVPQRVVRPFLDSGRRTHGHETLLKGTLRHRVALVRERSEPILEVRLDLDDPTAGAFRLGGFDLDETAGETVADGRRKIG